MRRLILAGSFVVLFTASCTTTSSTLNSSEPQRVYAKEYDEVFSEAVNVVSLLSWELTHTEKDAGIIQAETPMSLFTYGDEVTIRLEQQENGRVRVDMSSSTDQAVDWGKNEKNIQEFYAKLGELLGEEQKQGN